MHEDLMAQYVKEVDTLRAENERLRAALEAIAELDDPAKDTAALIAQQALKSIGYIKT